MKPIDPRRLLRQAIHHENLSNLPPETHRITGWPSLIKHLGYSRQMITRWIKREGFPNPEFHYYQKTDKLRVNVWRRTAMWDKRKVGDWFASRSNV